MVQALLASPQALGQTGRDHPTYHLQSHGGQVEGEGDVKEIRINQTVIVGFVDEC